MFQQPKKYPKYEKIFNFLAKSKWVLAMLFLGLSLSTVASTSAYFTHSTSIDKGMEFSFGSWIPTLAMSVSPEEPDGSHDTYKTTPCVTLAADIDGEEKGIKIYYEFSKDGDPLDDGIEYDGKCVPIPDGDLTHFQAQAVNEANTDWKSDVVSDSFQVNTTPIEEGSVVINEVMWMGSAQNEKDEWIELRNLTDEDIDLKNWRIDGAVSGHGHLEIAGDTKKKGGDTDRYIIPKHGYFLISRLDADATAMQATPDLVKKSLRLKDIYEKNGPLVLMDAKGNTIDSTPTADKLLWPAGWKGIFLHLSMERKNSPGDGTAKDNWHACLDLRGYGKDYWKQVGLNCGTPGAENLEADKLSKDKTPDTFNFDELDNALAAPSSSLTGETQTEVEDEDEETNATDDSLVAPAADPEKTLTPSEVDTPMDGGE